jgi:hypothetical protein
MSTARADLWWLPVGAGGHVVIHTSRWWELLEARLEHRSPLHLFHTALELFVDDRRYVIEMTPAWGQPTGVRGVVRTGPVGLRALGHFRLFRYEVRAWLDGTLPDRRYAVESPVTIPLTSGTARDLLENLARVPSLTWGRRVPPGRDMWNSNSLISWLLTSVGVDATLFVPPTHGRAPGWDAGIAQARSRS